MDIFKGGKIFFVIIFIFLAIHENMGPLPSITMLRLRSGTGTTKLGAQFGTCKEMILYCNGTIL